jgi:hypothetical protein
VDGCGGLGTQQTGGMSGFDQPRLCLAASDLAGDDTFAEVIGGPVQRGVALPFGGTGNGAEDATNGRIDIVWRGVVAPLCWLGCRRQDQPE